MKIGLSACSDGHIKEWEYQVDELVQVLKDFGMEVVLAPHIKAKVDAFSGTDEERAADLMRLYADDSIEAIYDISGGDLANGVLKYLDFDVIAGSNKVFWGYSDLTTVINAIYAITGRSSVLYQVKIGVFDKVAGILLGTFTNYEKEDYELSVYDLLKMHISDTMQVANTKEIGHGHDSKAIVVGERIYMH
nr:LD-carboxypeptidase [uncultured Butyrivibrio sp.]